MSDPAKEAKNMAAIYAAKQNHDATCPWKGEGKRINMTPFDIERMGWEEGDVIAGLTLVADSKLATGRFEVHCDNEPDTTSQLEKQVTDLVAAPLSSDDLVTA